MDRADELSEDTIAKRHLDHAVTKRRHELQLALRSEQLQVLLDLLRSPTSVPAGADADELLYENFVACYPNEDAWFRPHEILVPYLERLRSGSEQP